MRRSRRMMVFVTLLLTPALAWAQVMPPDSGSADSAAAGVGPGDFLVVNIWMEPDLSDTLRVDHSGMVVFPKLGPIRVTGIQPDSLERMLVRSYSQYLKNPSIRVAVLRRITVWGAVARPGSYPVDLTMTITDALALAGGASSEGKSNKVELRRGGDRRIIDLSTNSRARQTPLRSGDELVVPQRAWAARNMGFILGAVGTATSIVFLLAR